MPDEEYSGRRPAWEPVFGWPLAELIEQAEKGIEVEQAVPAVDQWSPVVEMGGMPEMSSNHTSPWTSVTASDRSVSKTYRRASVGYTEADARADAEAMEQYRFVELPVNPADRDWFNEALDGLEALTPADLRRRAEQDQMKAEISSLKEAIARIPTAKEIVAELLKEVAEAQPGPAFPAEKFVRLLLVRLLNQVDAKVTLTAEQVKSLVQFVAGLDERMDAWEEEDE